jgi:hypothetical protein
MGPGNGANGVGQRAGVSASDTATARASFGRWATIVNLCYGSAMRWALFILLLLTGPAIASPDPKDLARELMRQQSAPKDAPAPRYRDPGGGALKPDERRIAVDEYVQEIMALPQLSPEEYERLKEKMEMDAAWQAGIERGRQPQFNGFPRTLPRRNPWDN